MKNQWQTSHSETTTASPAAIWSRWTDVSGWPEEDTNLTLARLEGDFVVGSQIVMKPKGSPKSRVTITEVTPNKSFTTKGKIPMGELIISHSIEKASDGKTAFQHTITLTGPLRGIFVALFAKKLADNLPQKMTNIAKLAEER